MNFLQRSEGIEQMFEDLDRRHSVERLLIKLRVLETALEHPDAGWVRRSPVRDVDPDGFEVSASAKEEITPPAPEVEETARFHELHEPREPILSFPPPVFAVVNRLTLAAIWQLGGSTRNLQELRLNRPGNSGEAGAGRAPQSA